MGKVMTLPQAVAYRAQLRTAGRRVVLTNGHFDLLHVGHLDYLEKARALGDALIVGVNQDSTTFQHKGPGRPIVPDAERARLLAALVPVDAVVLFAEPTADTLIEQLRPDVYVKGGDYAHKPLPERTAAARVGAQIALIDYLPGHSTTALIERIRALPR
jgi:rfaE bifunctional protein nucleotidyltransferase chain/domain